MNEVQYIGESLWQGALGHLLTILTCVSALAGSIAFFKAVKGDQGWKTLGRTFYSVHAISVFGIIGLLLLLMIAQRYEYAYVWEHVSEDLPMRYLFSAFWEGQEGSFLLWLFWHAVLGFVALGRTGKWEAPVLGSLLLVQLFIGSMLLGIHFTDAIKIGVDPFALLRETMQAPIFARADYLSMVEGNGLNPLLQNYWMTIHPPTLFLGFASVTMPFCFAMGGLITKEHTAWLKPALPWALFSGGILGTGILMGGAWAYEALSFGGYWAWDPVENMSLVPWLILIAGIHGHLIARSTGESMRNTYILYITSFLLILYSTFLTRSGVLGDSSVHSFTQMGLEWQLVIFILFFAGWGIYALSRSWKSIPIKQESPMHTRSFWMFIGTLVLVFSAILIGFTTSIPVWNKLTDLAARLVGTDYSHLHRTAPVDPMAHYNKFQLWIAVCVALLSGVTQFLRYQEVSWEKRRKKVFTELAISALTAAALTFLLSNWIDANAWQYKVLLACAAFGVTANSTYLVNILRKSPKMAASGMAHLGFAVMLIGIMASGLNKQVISTNVFAQAGLIDGMDPGNFITLIKNRPMFMQNYWVEYESDTIKGNVREFLVSYKRINEDQDTVERFHLTPNVVFNNKQTKVEATNPSTKHYLSQDIFTYVAALPGEQMDLEEAKKINDTLRFEPFTLSEGDTVRTERFELWLNGVSNAADHPEYTFNPGDMVVQVSLGLFDLRREELIEREVLVYVREGLVYGFPAQVNDLNMRIRIPTEVISQFYVPENVLDYTEFNLKSGESMTIDGITYTMQGVDRAGAHPQYVAQSGDIAVNAILTVDAGGQIFQANPLYFIRGNRPGNFKSFISEIGAHIHFDRIDPESETFYFRAAMDDIDRQSINVEIAQNVPRNDIIVIEAIVFPGINLFWTGSILMMLGLFWAMFNRRRENRPA